MELETVTASVYDRRQADTKFDMIIIVFAHKTQPEKFFEIDTVLQYTTDLLQIQIHYQTQEDDIIRCHST